MKKGEKGEGRLPPSHRIKMSGPTTKCHNTQHTPENMLQLGILRRFIIICVLCCAATAAAVALAMTAAAMTMATAKAMMTELVVESMTATTTGSGGGNSDSDGGEHGIRLEACPVLHSSSGVKSTW
ncbi:hypothetical protein ACHAW5_000687 [Stephanodiscus triporus]|uniref:Uncharacterized protein n=1 Tax=Stephanodiscus triporus TaxID=2934178 RepID=A0ABD3NCA3_9STRA